MAIEKKCRWDDNIREKPETVKAGSCQGGENMRSVILISPSDKEIAHLYQQWKNEATNILVDYDKLNMVINRERIYIDYFEDPSADYEDDELVNVDIDTPSFYAMSYSDRDIMKYFIQNSVFSEGSFMDNDHGRIVRVDEVRKEEILDFIE